MDDLLAYATISADDKVPVHLIDPILHSFSPNETAKLACDDDVCKGTNRIGGCADAKYNKSASEYAAYWGKWSNLAESNSTDRDDRHVYAVSPWPALDNDVASATDGKQEGIESENEDQVAIESAGSQSEVRVPPGTGLTKSVSVRCKSQPVFAWTWATRRESAENELKFLFN